MLLVPGDPDYAAEASGFNTAVTHAPELIVAAASPTDVVRAVREAAERGTSLAVLATGHGASLSADGVLVTTRRMTGIAVDPVARTARLEAGVRWADVLAETVPHGLAPLNGSSPSVGVVGYVLGGGIGPLGRLHGYAADHVRSIELVTADGRRRRATPTEEPELFFALRGGKGNVGVVTAIEIDLFPVERFYGGGLYFDGTATSELLRTWVAWTDAVPDTVSSSVLLARYPDVEEVPEPLRGRFVAHLRFACFGPVADGIALVEPFRAIGPLLRDTLSETDYDEIGSIHHEPTEPVAAYDQSLLLGPLDAAAIATIVAHGGPDADAPFIVELRHHGGAYARSPAVPNAVGGRDAQFSLFAASLIEAATAARDREAHERLRRAVAPWATGGAVLNFLGVGDTAPERVRTAFTDGAYARLAAAKAAYDPTNMFRINHNVPPIAASKPHQGASAS